MNFLVDACDFFRMCPDLIQAAQPLSFPLRMQGARSLLSFCQEPGEALGLLWVCLHLAALGKLLEITHCLWGQLMEE